MLGIVNLFLPPHSWSLGMSNSRENELLIIPCQKRGCGTSPFSEISGKKNNNKTLGSWFTIPPLDSAL